MFQKYKLLIPTLVLIVLSAWTFINSGANYSLTIQHYLGLTAAIICAISFFAFRKLYKFVLGATLLFGLINLFNFTPGLTTTSLSFNSLSIGFQPYSLFVVILTVILALPKKGEVVIVQSDSAIKINQDQFNTDLAKFRELYKTKTTADLKEIIESGKFSPAAIEAAKQLELESIGEKGNV